MTRRSLARGNGGFTLLELMMVVIILAILAAIALPQYLRTSERARAAEALQMLGAMRSAQARYYALNNSTYTSDLNALDIDVPATTEDWSYKVNAGTKRGQAIREGGPKDQSLIEINLDTGKACSTETTWGLATTC